MSNELLAQPGLRPRSDLAKRLAHNPCGAGASALGCSSCPHYQLCGGLSVDAQIWDCFDLCCGKHGACERVCRRNESFVLQNNEIGGFDLEQVGEIPALSFTPTLDIIPTVYHGSTRKTSMQSPTVSLRFADLFNFRNGSVRFESREHLADVFKIRGDAEIILCGIDQDRRVEAWWSLGEPTREWAIAKLHEIGVSMITTPNFSMIMNRPRTNDLSSMKRIAVTHREFVLGGIPAALHVNGRTDRDFERWARFLQRRHGVSCIAFEFSTGSNRRDRYQTYIKWLKELQRHVSRPLDIVLRGNPVAIRDLRAAYRKVIYLETTSFMKTTKRKIARRAGNQKLRWDHYQSMPGEPLDKLLQVNSEEQASWLAAEFFQRAA